MEFTSPLSISKAMGSRISATASERWVFRPLETLHNENLQGEDNDNEAERNSNSAMDTLDDHDAEVIDLLTELFKENKQVCEDEDNSKDSLQEENSDESHDPEEYMTWTVREKKTKRKKELVKTRKKKNKFISDYFATVPKNLKDKLNAAATCDNYIKWAKRKEKELRNDAARTRNFNMCIRKKVEASKYWKVLEDSRHKLMQPTADMVDNRIQDEEEKAIFMGGDAVALYPSMDAVGTSNIIYETVLDSKIEFKFIDYDWLCVYLYLILGEDILQEYDLSEAIPARRAREGEKISKAKSLSAKGNRTLNNWKFNTHSLTEEKKKKMVALMIKITTLVLMDSTYYTFGGEIFKQLHGAGIGLRASACAAKIVMGKLDQLWASSQHPWLIIVQIYLRYIDDLRLYEANKKEVVMV